MWSATCTQWLPPGICGDPDLDRRGEQHRPHRADADVGRAGPGARRRAGRVTTQRERGDDEQHQATLSRVRGRRRRDGARSRARSAAARCGRPTSSRGSRPAAGGSAGSPGRSRSRARWFAPARHRDFLLFPRLRRRPSPGRGGGRGRSSTRRRWRCRRGSSHSMSCTNDASIFSWLTGNRFRCASDE